jgi:hypothetical protein
MEQLADPAEAIGGSLSSGLLISSIIPGRHDGRLG